jgi:hypothetical protein
MSHSPRYRSSLAREVADLHGRKRVLYGGRAGLAGADLFQDFASPTDQSESVADAVSREELVAQIWAAVLKDYADCAESGLLTETELRTYRTLLLEGRSMRAFSRMEGVSPAAISCRIEGLRFKAPKFYAWWITTHRSRRHAHAR